MGLGDKTIKFFVDILCKTPRATYHEELIAERLAGFAAERGLKHLRDGKNNIIIYKPATGKYTNTSTPVILQAHTDMVCVPVSADFSLGIDAYLSEEHRMTGRSAATGKKTSLGADNGIGVAVILEVLDGGSYIIHPPIVAIFTAEEECGLTGARDISKDDIVNIAPGLNFRNAKFINLDDGRHGQYSVGCAGSVNAVIKIPIERNNSLPENPSFFELTVSGLTGGHSGLSIHEMRANANVLLCDAVRRIIYSGIDVSVVKLAKCGDAANAIPSNASAIIAAPRTQSGKLGQTAAMIEKIFRDRHQSTDPNLRVDTPTITNRIDTTAPYSKKTLSALLSIAASVPDGLLTWSANMPGLAETSSNLGIIADDGESIVITCMVRSSVDALRELVADDMRGICAAHGAGFESSSRSPGWAYKAENRLRDLFLDKYKKLFGADGAASAVHAGLECGHFAAKFAEFDGMDFISCGPTIADIHGINETLHTDTVPKFVKLLAAVLEDC
ncbi:MAG: M20/M25/M40 family metallo-hydrolase [Chitinispirillales bacterium]|jgi:dipeptidase D|nr:M20/M25/M40 family metallo-hydrolase [Chitinispirillales bacterium]